MKILRIIGGFASIAVSIVMLCATIAIQQSVLPTGCESTQCNLSYIAIFLGCSGAYLFFGLACLKNLKGDTGMKHPIVAGVIISIFTVTAGLLYLVSIVPIP
ncbi:MAG: hypothetical protein ACI9AR_000077 [Flavobacteriaceae bacterium]|jgi:hypothetical protein